jgi:hypothetical protein
VQRSFASSLARSTIAGNPIFPPLHFGQCHGPMISRSKTPTRRLANMCGRKQSNPTMTKSLTEIRSVARSHTRTALNVLVGVMRNTKAPAPARIAAANAILDRGWGKATQAIETSADGALELIHRIERVIVHPENPDSPGV